MTDNRALATRAQTLAEQHPAGSLEHRAAACAAVCLRTTRTLTAARRALAGIPPADVRQAAEQLLDRLTTDPATPNEGDRP